MNISAVLRRPKQIATYDARGATGIKSFRAFDGLRGYMDWWVVIGHALHLCRVIHLAPKTLCGGAVLSSDIRSRLG